jgi:RHS repeat-associated protein
MLQSSFFDPVLGVDIHIVLVPTPAGPVPTPVPMPFVGMVFDPVGLAIGAAIGMATGGGPGLVLVNSMPVTNAGTNVTNMLTMPHLPVPGVAFAKGLPGNDAELFFGSLNVNLAGSLGVRLGEIALSCSDPVRLPTSVVLAIPKGMPVLNMPTTVPDLAGIAQRLVMLGAMRLLRAVARGGARLFRALRATQRRSNGWARVSRALRGAVDRIAPQRFRDRLKRAVCFVTGHPVDVATGRVFTDNIDFELPGPLPLVFERVYSSSLSWRNGPLGYGWSHSLDQQVWLEPGKVVLLAEDGREIEFHTDGLSERVIRAGQPVYDATNRLTLRALGNLRWDVEAANGVVREFAPVPGGDSQRARLQRIRSRDGHHSIQLTYDARGLLEWVRDCGGRLIAFVHDKQRRLAEVKLPLSRESGFYRHLKYVYGASGDLVEVVDAAGHSWKFEYRGHLLVQESDRTGLSFYFQYDGLGASARCVRTWGDGGIYDHLISYGVPNRKTMVENSLGAVTVYQMDELGMVVKVTDPHGAVTEYAYDEDCGELAKEVDALGHERLMTYDERGNIVAVQGRDGARVRIECDARGLPVRALDALEGEWRWTYDSEGHLLERQAPTGERISYGWGEGLLTWVAPPGKPRILLEYDKQKNLIRERASEDSATEYEYDSQGRLVRTRDARGAVLRVRYDVLGNPVRLESPTGVIQEMTYDAERNILMVRDVTRHIRLVYGHFHKIVAREEADTTIRFLHDTEGRPTTVINEAGEVSTFILDACGRVLEERGFDGGVRRYQRDLLGQVIKRYLPSGTTTEYTYDALGRVVKVSRSDGTHAEFTYRADGALVRARNECSEVVLERDALGRVSREVQGDGVVVSRFDAHGERTLVETSLGARMAVVRDEAGAVSALHLGAVSPLKSRAVMHFERDLLGLETARVFPGGVRLEWERDVAGRPTVRRSVRSFSAGPPQRLEERTYQWRGDDQLASLIDGRYGSIVYEHDARGRLISQKSGGRELHRTMDTVGNVFRHPLQGDRRYGPGGRLEEASGSHFEYDADGNRLLKRAPDGRTWHYRWSAAGLLHEVERPDGSRVRFQYDPFARRIKKQILQPLEDGSEQLESETRFVWDRHVVIHELSSEAGLTTWYWEPESFTPVMKEQAERSWAIAPDHLGTPAEFYDESGELAWKAQLDIFGVLSVEVGRVEDCPWRWPGQYEDSETGLYANRWRYYDANTGQYTSQDPLGALGGLNLYGYAPEPFIYIDPLGLIIVFRNLRPDEDPAQGLSARRPGRGMTPAGHVRNGSKPTFRGSQFISTTTDPAVALRYREPGQRTVMIDTDQLVPDTSGNRRVVDLSTPELARSHGLRGPAAHYAANSSEVLLEGRVPSGAMVEVSEADLRGACR